MISMLKKMLLSIPSDTISNFTAPGKDLICISPLDSAGNEPDPYTLYYGEYSGPFAAKNYHDTNFLLYCDRDKYPEPSFPERCNTIIVFSNENMSELIKTAVTVLNEKNMLGRINSELLALIGNSPTMQALLNYGSEVLGNPMLAIDISFAYIASSLVDDIYAKPSYNWQYTVENGLMPDSYISEIRSKETSYLDSESDDPQIIITDTDSRNYSRAYSVRFIYNGEVYGFIKVLEQNREITPFDQEVLLMMSRYAGIIAGMMVNKEGFFSDPTENLFSSLLNGRIAPESAVSALQTHFSLKIFKNIYMVNVQFRSKPDSADHISFTHKRLKAFFNRSIVTMAGSGFVILYDTNEDRSPFTDHDSAFYKNLIRLLEEINCTADISFVFHDIRNTMRYYAQTNFCMEYRYMTSCEDPILLYSEIYEYEMITALKDRVDYYSLIHPAVLKLMDIDNTYGSELTKTLFTYVNNHLSITATAEELYLHYNTVKHRIGKIVDATSFDENDKDEVFRVMLSEKNNRPDR